MNQRSSLSLDELRELIYRGVESDVLDYKAALNWNQMNRIARGKIVRHCLALANTRGGCIVIGVGEDASGRPTDYQGLSEEEIHSFDPSTVGPFVNHYVEPPLDFTIERPEIDGKQYAVLVVRPFKTLPHVCTCGVETELHTGVFYIRTTDASSRPAYRAIEMQALIQRALRNQREELGRMLRGILYENENRNGSAAPDGDVPQFDAAVDNATVFFRRRKNPPAGLRSVLLNFSVAPPAYDPERLTLSAIRRAAERAWNVRSGSGFVGSREIRDAYVTNVSLRSLPEHQLKMWQVFRSGLFHFVAWIPAPGDALNFEAILHQVAEGISFLAGLYAELGLAEEVLTLRLRLEGVEELTLALAGHPESGWRCRIPEIEIVLRRSAADLASGVCEHAARLVREIAERFNVPEAELQHLTQRIRDYLEKR